MPANEDLFRFTRGRFLVEDAERLAERYVSFDVAALGRHAATVLGANSCTKIEKHHEGICNKILLLTMDNGTQAIAKIPQPNAGIPHQTIASEVATMEFAREVLNTPVPKVFAWSSKATESEIGVEYILMEKCRGVQLNTVWSRMNVEQRTWLMASLAQIHSRWAKTSFDQYGSLYFASDIDDQHSSNPLHSYQDGQSIEHLKYAIGPSNDHRNFDSWNRNLEFHRGPWKNVEEYFEGLGKREIACVRQSSRFPKSHYAVFGPGTYIPTKDKKLKALDCYLKTIKYFLPEQDICRSTLSHPSPDGIFVNPDNPKEITGFIDWQASELGPLFLRAHAPKMPQYDGAVIPGAEPPSDPRLVEQFGQATSNAGNQIFTNMIHAWVDDAYRKVLGATCESLLQAQQFRQTDACKMLVMGSCLFFDLEPSFMWRLLGLKQSSVSNTTSSAEFPLKFQPEEEQIIRTDLDNWNSAGEAMQRIFIALGDVQIFNEFMVSPVQYDETMAVVRRLKYHWFRQLEHERIVITEEQRREALMWWPFDD